MNETVQHVIAAIRENRRTFEEFCYSLSEEQLAAETEVTAAPEQSHATEQPTQDRT